MCIKKFLIVLTSCVCLVIAGGVHATDIAKWSLSKTQKPDEEFLLYRLSYSGFFTAFIWKDLADVVIVADNKSYQFNRQKSCQLNLKMSTEDFVLSELVSPMRFHWRTTVSPDLSRVFLVEEINKNEDEDDSHEVVWINQQKKQVEIYHKRKKVAVHAIEDDPFDDDDSDEDDQPEMMWQPDGKKKAPAFLVDEAGMEDGLDYLVFDKAVKIKADVPVFDPLSLIYSARWYDYGVVKKVDFVVTHEDSFRKYQVQYAGKETLEIDDKTVDAIRVDIKRNKEEAESDEGYMIIWLSDDERRIPLQYLIKVKSGTIKLKINASNLESYQTPVNCINRKPVSVTTSITGNTAH